jgi:hypothetical protein
VVQIRRSVDPQRASLLTCPTVLSRAYSASAMAITQSSCAPAAAAPAPDFWRTKLRISRNNRTLWNDSGAWLIAADNPAINAALVLDEVMISST